MYFIGKFLILETFYIPPQANQAGQDFMGGGGALPHAGYCPEYIYLIYK